MKPTRYDYWGNLGDAYRLMGDASKAREAYSKAITLSREAINLNKTDGIAMSSLASYLAKSGDKAEAMRWAQQSESSAAKNSDVFYDLALAYELSGERTKALEALRRAVALGYSQSIVAKEPDLNALRKDLSYSPMFQ